MSRCAEIRRRCSRFIEGSALAVVQDGSLVKALLVGVEHQVDEAIPKTDRAHHDDVEPKESQVILVADLAVGGESRGGEDAAIPFLQRFRDFGDCQIKVSVDHDGRDHSQQPDHHEGKDGELCGQPAAETTPLAPSASSRSNPDQTSNGRDAHNQNTQVEWPAEQSVM